jgi:hypothetical protein
MSTYSPNLRIELPTNGTQSGVWGDTTNNNLTYILEAAVSGYQAVPVAATPYVLTYTNGPTSTKESDQAVYAMLRFTSSPGTAFSVFAPPSPKTYIIWNSSGQTATIYNSTSIGNTTAAGAYVTIADGSKIMVWSDGTNFYEVQSQSFSGVLPVANGGTGQSSNLTQYGVIYGSTTTAMGTTLAGTSTQVLHGNASGAPTWGSVALGADVSGTLPIANGGTNSTATPTNGGVTYGTGTAQAYTAAGTSGYVLKSNGAAAPTWIAQSSIAAGSATNAGLAAAALNAYTADSATNASSAATLSSTLAVNKGGTGLTSSGTAGYVLTSNGSAWVSSPGSAATGGGSDQTFFLNDLTITTDYTIPSTKNAGTFGPITIDTGVTVTVPDPSTWTIV